VPNSAPGLPWEIANEQVENWSLNGVSAADAMTMLGRNSRSATWGIVRIAVAEEACRLAIRTERRAT
jgi:hypothetical protein